MSNYENIPTTPSQSNVLGDAFSKGMDIAAQSGNEKTGIILKDKNIEGAIVDLAMDGNPVGALAKFGANSLKEEVCSPTQIQGMEDARRTSGIPITQGIVLGVEKISSLVMGRDVELDGTMKAAQAVDSIAKPIATGGASLLADSLYDAGRDVSDANDCMKTGKEIEVAYHGEDIYKPGTYPYDVTVTAQSTEPFDPNAMSDEMKNEIAMMYSTKNAMSPNGEPNPNIDPAPGQNVDPAPESRTPLNVKITPRPTQSMGGPSM
jgi:hypothetical protein